MRPNVIGASLVMILSAAVPSYGGPQAAKPQAEIIGELSPKKLASVLKSLDITFTQESPRTTTVFQLQPDGKTFAHQPSETSTTFRLQLDGREVLLETTSKTVRLLGTLPETASLDQANSWNQQHRFGRAFIDAKKHPCFEADIDLTGGVTQDNLEAVVRAFRTSLGLYVSFLQPAVPPSQVKPEQTSLRTYARSQSAKTRIPAQHGDFALWIDDAKWKQTPSAAGGPVLENANGESFVRIISERMSIPAPVLKGVVLQNAKSAAPDTKLTLEERRIVNGREVLALQFEGTIQGIAFRYFGYYYGGTSGTIQVIGYSPQQYFAANLADLEELLNGLEINDTEARSAPASGAPAAASQQGKVVLNDGKISVSYDRTEWKQGQQGQAGRVQLTHTSGDAYALIIVERLSMPLDSLVDVALANAREADPDAEIVFREKRVVNGVEVWFLKLKAAPNKVPLWFYGYYHSGKSGTVQVLTYTGQDFIDEYQADFMEFLNGLRVAD